MYYGAVLSPVIGRPNFIREIVLQSDDQMATSRHWQPGGRVSPTTCLLTGHHVTVRLHSTRRLRHVGLVRGSPGSEYEVLWLIIPEDDPQHSVHGRYWQRALRYHEASRRKDRKRELFQPKKRTTA
jgi:hypothetical protein